MPRNVSKKKGRKGMDLWRVLVLAIVRLGCNWDYDKLHEMANNHLTIREMLGHSRHVWDNSNKYQLQTVKDNVKMITPEIPKKINDVVVRACHNILSKKKEKSCKQALILFQLKRM